MNRDGGVMQMDFLHALQTIACAILFGQLRVFDPLDHVGVADDVST
jgi:hypothetical protein